MSEQKLPTTQLGAGKRVMLEGHNLLLQGGTGIATYTRTLVGCLQELGFGIELLAAVNRAVDGKDRQLAEIALFDAPRNFNLLHKAHLELRRLVGAPFGIRPGVIEGLSDIVVRPASALDAFERIHMIAHMLDVEKLHFMRHKRRLKVRVDQTPDIFHATRPAPLHVPGAANIYTIHDIVPLRLPYTTSDDKAYHIGMVRELVRSADHIVTVSEFSRQDLIKHTGIEPTRITNTYQSVEFPEDLLSIPDSDITETLNSHFGLEFDEYFLFVGAIEPKKNISRLVDAFAASGIKRPLVIAGGAGWMNKPDMERINSERFLSYVVKDGQIFPRRQVRHLSYLPFRDVVALMRGARALFYPSIYEGFGLPPIEAMSVGTPVMTSNTSSLLEVTGEAAMHVDPYDIDKLAKAMRTFDEDADLRSELSKRGRAQAETFSNARFLSRMDSFYTKVLDGSSK